MARRVPPQRADATTSSGAPPASQPASGLSGFRMLDTDSSYPGPEARPAAVVLACRRGTCKTEACLPPGSRGRAPASRPVSREPERYPEGARAGWGALAPGGCPPLGTGLPAATERPAGPEGRADRAAAAGRRGKSTGMESVNLRARVGRAGGRGLSVRPRAQISVEKGVPQVHQMQSSRATRPAGRTLRPGRSGPNPGPRASATTGRTSTVYTNR